jgi:very-long-chain enoyl-CoA reductase
MEVSIKDRKGRDLAKLSVDQNMTLKDLKKLYLSETKEKKIAFNRQWFNLNEIKGPSVNDNTKKLSELGIKNGDVLYIKDLGLQISWKLVFLIEYFGPIGIFAVLYYFRNLFYGAGAADVPFTFTQKAGFWMVVGHYLKRELETLFIHRFSSETMPIKNLFINCTHYWVIFGTLVGYFLMHPKYTEPTYIPMNLKYVLIVAFAFFQLMNFLCHNELKNLRKPGTTERGIPKGYGFGMVSCANYMWESLVWTSYSVLTGCTTSYLFLIFSAYQMTEWALKKHKRYQADFPDYPKERKAIIPYVL